MAEAGNTYTIRAHHGMCLAFFKGNGYSSNFTENMEKMKNILAHNPKVRIVNRTDDICVCCPHNGGKTCEEAEKTDRYDAGVLEGCGFLPDTEMYWKEFEASVYENILAAGKREEICGDCQWDALCK